MQSGSPRVQCLQTLSEDLLEGKPQQVWSPSNLRAASCAGHSGVRVCRHLLTAQKGHVPLQARTLNNRKFLSVVETQEVAKLRNMLTIDLVIVI